MNPTAAQPDKSLHGKLPQNQAFSGAAGFNFLILGRRSAKDWQMFSTIGLLHEGMMLRQKAQVDPATHSGCGLSEWVVREVELGALELKKKKKRIQSLRLI